MTTDFKLKLYPALIGVLTTIIAILLLGRATPLIWKTSSRSPSSGSLAADRPLALTGVSSIATVPWTESLPEPAPVPVAVIPTAPLPDTATQVGRFRVRNTTSHVVRVVLLSQQVPPTSDNSPYREAVHWDFAPGEGVGRGLILYLPDGELQLQSNDVLMAFSLDGSQRYWGPYVVGQTSLPVWNGNTQEWTLDLTPQSPVAP